MNQEKKTQYYLSDVKWCYTYDGNMVMPYIWNRDRTKIKYLFTGNISRLNLPEVEGGKELSEQTYNDCLKRTISDGLGLVGHFNNNIGLCNSEFLLLHQKSNKKHLSSKVMRRFALHNFYIKVVQGLVRSSECLAEEFVHEQQVTVEDLVPLAQAFSKTISQQYKDSLALQEEMAYDNF